MNEPAVDLSDRCSVCGQDVETIGNVSDSALKEQGVPEVLIALVRSQSEAIQSHMSPPGKLGLTALLDKRRLQYGLVDELFGIQAVFDRVYVAQIPGRGAKETYGNTTILKTQITKAREEFECPRGILISAGLGAMDTLASNGIALGHVVTLLRQSPWRMEMAEIAGDVKKILVLRAGDLSGSEDLALSLRHGEAELVYQDDEHVFVDPDGTPWKPSTPYISPEY